MPEAGVEKARAEEVKRRVDDIRSWKAEMVSQDEIRRRLAARLLNDTK
jgi:hypothetical protein